MFGPNDNPEDAIYEDEREEMKTVKSLMTGEEVEIPINTPRSCDPSTELFWSM